MTEEEKQLLVNFLGQTYADSKQYDDKIATSSNALQPRANVAKTQLEQLLKQPTTQNEQLSPPQLVQSPTTPIAAPPVSNPSIQTVDPAAAALELAQLQGEVCVTNGDQQMSFDFVEKLNSPKSEISDLVDAIKALTKAVTANTRTVEKLQEITENSINVDVKSKANDTSSKKKSTASG